MKTFVNLLPASQRRKQMLRRRLFQWASVIGVLMLCGGAWHSHEMRENTVLTQQFESLVREHEPVQAILQQLVEMRQQMEDLQKQEAVARELEYQRNALALLGVVSQAARNTEGRLRVTKLELTDFQNPSPASGKTPPSGLLLTGLSLDYPAVGELLESLQDSGLFSSVELLTSKERQDHNVSFREYQIRCGL